MLNRFYTMLRICYNAENKGTSMKQHIVKIPDYSYFEGLEKAEHRDMSLSEYLDFLISNDNNSGYARKDEYYSTWINIKQRCDNKNNHSYMNYGGRGIGYHDDFDDYMKFKRYIKTLDGFGDKGLSLDRINNDGDYTYNNLRFVTKDVQARNQRVRKTNKCGYTGITTRGSDGKYEATVTHQGKRKYIGLFAHVKDALEARNIFIQNNQLPHKIQEYRG